MNPSLTRQPNGEIIAIMVTWNGAAFLHEAVSSVLQCLDERCDILVVDNASQDDTFELLQRQFPQVAILRNPVNVGGAGGFNAGMRVALNDPKCRYVWLLDNDIFAEPGALETLVRRLQDRPEYAAAGSQICLYSKPELVQEVGAFIGPWLGNAVRYGSGKRRLSASHPLVEVDYLAACSVLIRAAALRSVGLFADFFVFYDDVEWGQRATKLGWRLVAVPESVVRHRYSGLKSSEPWREYYRKRNRLAYLALHPPKRGSYLVVALYVAFVGFLALQRSLSGSQSYASAYWRALLAVLRGQFGVEGRPGPLPAGRQSAPPDDCGDHPVWLPMRGSLGDALKAANEICGHFPLARCYLPANIPDRSMVPESACLSFAHSPVQNSVVVTGESIPVAALRATRVYQYRHGEWRRLRWPLGAYLWQLLGVMVSSVFGAAAAVALTPWILVRKKRWQLFERIGAEA